MRLVGSAFHVLASNHGRLFVVTNRAPVLQCGARDSDVHRGVQRLIECAENGRGRGHRIGVGTLVDDQRVVDHDLVQQDFPAGGAALPEGRPAVQVERHAGVRWSDENSCAMRWFRIRNSGSHCDPAGAQRSRRVVLPAVEHPAVPVAAGYRRQSVRTGARTPFDGGVADVDGGEHVAVDARCWIGVAQAANGEVDHEVRQQQLPDGRIGLRQNAKHFDCGGRRQVGTAEVHWNDDAQQPRLRDPAQLFYRPGSREFALDGAGRDFRGDRACGRERLVDGVEDGGGALCGGHGGTL